MRSLNQDCVWKRQRGVKEWEEAPLSLYLKMVILIKLFFFFFLIKLFVRGFCFLHSLQWGWWGSDLSYPFERWGNWGLLGWGLWPAIGYGPRLEEASDLASVFLGKFFPCSQAAQWPERKSELGNFLKEAIKEAFLLSPFLPRYSLDLITLWILGV